MELPKFRYHPDPIATGAIEPSEERCECCGKANGYICTSTIYAEEEIEFICPWCVADGSAAKKFDGSFSDDYPLHQAGVADEVISEVCERTPGFISWQQERWLHHCNDACEYHGDADKADLERLSGADLEEFLREEMIKPDVWKGFLPNYEKGGNPAVYKFRCRHCSKSVYYMDYT